MALRLSAEADRLSVYPALGRVVAETAGQRFREIIVAPYRVVYRFDAERDHVEILAVVHGSRNFPELSERDETSP